MAENDAPVRVCCGQRHYGVECPDGLVMCCICFRRVPVEALNLNADRMPEDVCADCGRRERSRVIPPGQAQ